MAKKRVADLLVETLAQAGVERIYGVSGDSLNGITDSIRRQKQIRWAHVRHEESAAFAAGAEAHLTGRLAVCAGSCGPGNLHLINGLYDCHRSRVPVAASKGLALFQTSTCISCHAIRGVTGADAHVAPETATRVDDAPAQQGLIPLPGSSWLAPHPKKNSPRTGNSTQSGSSRPRAPAMTGLSRTRE